MSVTLTAVGAPESDNWHVKAQPNSGPMKLRYCLVSGHDTREEAEWMAERLWLLFGVAARVEDSDGRRT